MEITRNQWCGIRTCGSQERHLEHVFFEKNAHKTNSRSVQFPIKPQLARLYRSSAKLTRSVFRIGDIENLQFDKRAGAAADETF